MNLIDIFYLLIQIILLLALLRLITLVLFISKMRNWRKKYKERLLDFDEKLTTQYNSDVLSNQDYQELQEFISDKKGLAKLISSIGIDYLDFDFFYRSTREKLKNPDESLHIDFVSKSIISLGALSFYFEMDIILSRIISFLFKLSIVYLIIMILYTKIFM